MINLVLKKDKDYSDFVRLLNYDGLTFKRSGKGGRIISVETSENANSFKYRNHDLVLSCTDPVRVDVAPHLVTTHYDKIYTRYLRQADYDTPNLYPNSWGIQQLIRKRSFARYGTIPQPDLREGKFGCVRTGLGVDYYSCDVGFRPTHEQFGGRAVHLDGSTGYTKPGQHHGTATASCAIGNTIGLARNALGFFHEISAVVTNDDTVMLSFFDPIYQHYLGRAGTNRPAVVNCSLGFTTTQFTAPVVALFDDMISDGLILCISSGNDRANLDFRPFYAPVKVDSDVLAVGSHDLYDRLMHTNWNYGSNYGADVDIYGPGTYVATANPASDNSYSVVSGTSYSSPYVAGMVACMLEGYQRLTSRAQVQAVNNKVVANSVPRLKYSNSFRLDANPQTILNRAAYINPHLAIEPIDGLVPV